MTQPAIDGAVGWSAATLTCMATEPGRRFPDVREVLTHPETRMRVRLWWKLVLAGIWRARPSRDGSRPGRRQSNLV
jgi:hypothetical protein